MMSSSESDISADDTQYNLEKSDDEIQQLLEQEEMRRQTELLEQASTQSEQTNPVQDPNSFTDQLGSESVLFCHQSLSVNHQEQLNELNPDTPMLGYNIVQVSPMPTIQILDQRHQNDPMTSHITQSDWPMITYETTQSGHLVVKNAPSKAFNQISLPETASDLDSMGNDQFADNISLPQFTLEPALVNYLVLPIPPEFPLLHTQSQTLHSVVPPVSRSTTSPFPETLPLWPRDSNESPYHSTVSNTSSLTKSPVKPLINTCVKSPPTQGQSLPEFCPTDHRHSFPGRKKAVAVCHPVTQKVINQFRELPASEETHQASFNNFATNLQRYSPVIPDATSQYIMSRQGIDVNGPQTDICSRFLGVATQKVVSDILIDAFALVQKRGQGQRDGDSNEVKYTLTKELVDEVLKEQGLQL